MTHQKRSTPPTVLGSFAETLECVWTLSLCLPTFQVFLRMRWSSHHQVSAQFFSRHVPAVVGSGSLAIGSVPATCEKLLCVCSFQLVDVLLHVCLRFSGVRFHFRSRQSKPSEVVQITPILCAKPTIDQFFHPSVYWIGSCPKQKSTVQVQGQKQSQFSSCVVFHGHRTSAPQLSQKHWSCQTLPSMQVPQPRASVKPCEKLARPCFGECSNCGQSTR